MTSSQQTAGIIIQTATMKTLLLLLAALILSLTAAAPLQEEDRGEAGTSGHSSHVQADSEEVP